MSAGVVAQAQAARAVRRLGPWALLLVVACSKIERLERLAELPIPDPAGLRRAAARVIYDHGQTCPEAQLSHRHTGYACRDEPVVAVFCQDGRPSGRRQRTRPPNVRLFAYRCPGDGACGWEQSGLAQHQGRLRDPDDCVDLVAPPTTP